MASIKIISDVALYSPLTAVSGITTPSINVTQSFVSPEITLLGNASATWDETYTTLKNNSASWVGGGSDVSILSSNWETTYTTVNTTSASWQNTSTLVSQKSADWDLSPSSSNDMAVRSLTGKWENTTNSVQINSSYWQEAYNNVQSNSSNWIDQDIITPSMWGASTAVPQFNINSAGKITYITEQTITPAAIGAATSMHTHTVSNIDNFNTEVSNYLNSISNMANGYVRLGSDVKIPSYFIPGTVDEIVELGQVGPPSVIGDPTKIYLTTSDNKVWRWGTTQFIEILPSPGSTDSVPEGSINKYYTFDKVQNDAPVKKVNNKTGEVIITYSDVDAAPAVHTHSVANIDDFTTSVESVILASKGISSPEMNGTAAIGVSNTWAPIDHIHPTDTSLAPLYSPTFTGTLNAPVISATNIHGNFLYKIYTKESSFTLNTSDAGSIIKCNHVSDAIVITLPYQASDDILPGTEIFIIRNGSAAVSIEPQNSNVFLFSANNKNILSNTHSLATLIYTGNNEWLLAGDIS